MKYDTVIKQIVAFGQSTIYYGNNVQQLTILPVTLPYSTMHIHNVVTNGTIWVVSVIDGGTRGSYIVTGNRNSWQVTLHIPTNPFTYYDTVGDVAFADNLYFAATKIGMCISSDGYLWIPTSVPFSVNTATTLNVANGKLFASNYLNAYIYSSSGSWTEVSFATPFLSIQYLEIPQLYVTTGGQTIYYSSDGITWTQSSVISDDPEGIFITAVTSDGTNWVLAGGYDDDFGSNFLFLNT